MPEIVRHLVDEARRVRAIDPRVIEIAASESRDVVGRLITQYAGVARGVDVRIPPLQVEHDAGHVGQFLRPFDHGVRRQDLLEECRSRARQAEDENRIAVRQSEAVPRGEELGGAILLLVGGIELDDLGPIPALGPLQSIAAFVVLPRRRVILAVLVGLAESEAEVVAIHGMRAGRRFGGFESGKFLVREAVGLEIRQAPVRIAEVRPDSGRAPVGGDRLVAPPQCLLRMGD